MSAPLSDDEWLALMAVLKQRRTNEQLERIVERRDVLLSRIAGNHGTHLYRLTQSIMHQIRDLSYGIAKPEAQAVRDLAPRISSFLAKKQLRAFTHHVSKSILKDRSVAIEDGLLSYSQEAVDVLLGDKVRARKWYTAEDDRVCKICEPRHGVVYIYGNAPKIPAHPRCRCMLWPVIV